MVYIHHLISIVGRGRGVGWVVFCKTIVSVALYYQMLRFCLWLIKKFMYIENGMEFMCGKGMVNHQYYGACRISQKDQYRKMHVYSHYNIRLFGLKGKGLGVA